MVLLPEMGAFCVEELLIWTSGVTALEEEVTGLVFGAIFNDEFFIKDGDKEEKAESFSKFLKLWTQGSMEKKRV